MSSRTAAVHREFTLPPYGRGILFRDLDEMTEIIRRAEGSETPRSAFTRRATARSRWSSTRSRRSSGQTAPPAMSAVTGSSTAECCCRDLIDRAARIGIHVVSQPGFIAPLGDGWLRGYGEERTSSIHSVPCGRPGCGWAVRPMRR